MGNYRNAFEVIFDTQILDISMTRNRKISTNSDPVCKGRFFF